MPDAADLSNLHAALVKYRPVKLVAYNGAAVAARIKIGAGRKRWDAAMKAAASVEWDRVQLLDAHRQLLHVVVVDPGDEGDEGADVVPPPAAPVLPDLVPPAAPVASPGLYVTAGDLMAWFLQIFSMAQKGREREIGLAMSTYEGAARMLTEAVGSLASVQRSTLEAQGEAHKAQIAAVLSRAQQIADEGAIEGEAPPSETDKLMATLAPMMLAKLMAPTPAPPPRPAAPNGAKS